MTASPIDGNHDLLVRRIYQGVLEQPPWQSALQPLREALDAQVVSMVLRPPSEEDRGVIRNCVRPRSKSSGARPTLADPGDWEVTAYREQFFSLDPFVNLPLDQVIALEDILPDAALTTSDYYLHYLEPVGLFRILGVDTGEPDGLLVRLRFSRRREEPAFNADDRALLQALTPHLRQATLIYHQLSRAASERDIYSGAVDQLSMATIILDTRGGVLTTNALAAALLKDDAGLRLRNGRLQLERRDANQALQDALDNVLRAQQAGRASLVRALRIARPGGRPPLGLVIKPVPVAEGVDGQVGPCAAVFISDPEQRDHASQQILGELFSLTPAEANVAILLSRGLSLTEVAEAQNISPHTARAQLKSIFAKTGATRQAELVRMVIKSVASLG